MSHLVGIKVYQEYVWEYGGLRHLAIHGHQFDRFVIKNVRMNYLATLLYLQLQKFDSKNKPVARFLDRLNTRWLRMSAKVASGALIHARAHGVQRIFCGHTHATMQQEQDGICYYNSGGWIDSRPTYITIGEEGVRVHEYTKRTNDRDPRQERGEAHSSSSDVAAESGLSEDAEYQSVGS